MADKPGRKNQPRCRECSHPISFHGGEKKVKCRALGCTCPAWVEPTPQPAPA